MMQNKFFCNKCSICKDIDHFGFEDRLNEEQVDFLLVSTIPTETANCLGVFFPSEQKEFFETCLLRGIREKPFNYLCCSVVFCRPYDKDNKARLPNTVEVLQCADNFLNYVQYIKPKFLVFTDDISYKYYGNEWVNTVKITSLDILIRQGGRGGPLYTVTKRILKEALKCI